MVALHTYKSPKKMAYSRQRLPNTTPLSRGGVKARFVTNTAEKYSRTWPNSWNIHVMHVIFTRAMLCWRGL